MKIQDEMIVKFADGVRARKEEFGLLIVSKTTPALSLNKDGEFLWNLIDGHKTVKELVELTKKEFNENARSKVLELLQNLVDLGLCVVNS